jgi:hypothetical protein
MDFLGDYERIHRQNTKKKKLTEFILYLLLPFYLNRYSGGVYNRIHALHPSRRQTETVRKLNVLTVRFTGRVAVYNGKLISAAATIVHGFNARRAQCVLNVIYPDG